MISTPITRPITSRIASAIAGARVGGVSYDYYVDSVNGNDANDGTTADQAWASISSIDASIIAPGEKRRVLVRQGVYDTASDYLAIEPAGTDVTGSVLDIVFESGCVMDGANMAGSEHGVEISGDYPGTYNLYGNGLVIKNYMVSGSPNGVGCRGKAIVNCYDVHVENCDDGFSGHGEAVFNIYDCTAKECAKSPFIHVQSCVVTARRCVFTEKVGGGTEALSVTDTQGNITINCYDCQFVPDSSGKTCRVQGATFVRCKFGEQSMSLNIYATAAPAAFEDSYINVSFDGNSDVEFTRCYGKFSVRIRDGGSVILRDSVIVGPATGQTSCLYSNYNSGGSDTLEFRNTLFAGSYTLSSLDAANGSNLLAGNTVFDGNHLTDGKSFDSDVDVSLITNQTTGDGQLVGPANTLEMIDYATTLTTAGFTVADVT